METVGPVILEDSNGNEVARMNYTTHRLLRNPQVAYNGLWYVQNRQDADGAWIYRAISDVTGTMRTDPNLKELTIG